MRGRTAACGGAGLLLLGGLCIATPATGAADPGPAVTVPRIPVPADVAALRLLTASGQRIVAAEHTTYGYRVAQGPRGSELSLLPSVGDGDPFALFGSSFAWTQDSYDGDTGTSAWTLHRTDLDTGQSTTLDLPGAPVALTPDGWLSLDAETLVRHTPGSADVTLLTGVDSQRAFDVQADATGLVVSYGLTGDGNDVNRIGLITFGRPGIEPLNDPGHDVTPIGAFTWLGPDAIVWESSPRSATGARFIHRRARFGGAVTTVSLPPLTDTATLYANDDQLAILDGTHLRVHSAGTWTTVVLPGVPETVIPGPSEFLASIGATVYSVSGGTVTAIASSPAVLALPGDVHLSAGSLTYSGIWGFESWDPQTALRRRSLTRTPTLTLGTEQQYGPLLVTPLPSDWQPRDGDPDSAPVSSVSAGRGVILKSDWQEAELLDRGVIRHFVPWYEPIARIRASGPYTLLDDQVFDADGRQVLNLAKAHPTAADLYGQDVVYCTSTGSVRHSRISVPVLNSGPSAPNEIGTGCSGQVAIWGTTVAWTGPGGTIEVTTLPEVTAVGPIDSATIGVIDAGPPVLGLRISEGALTWRTARLATDHGDQLVLDLRRPSTPVRISGLHTVDVDDHLIAGVDDVTGEITVRPLPFGSTDPYRPRLIGVTSPSSFRAHWIPQFDVTKPVGEVQLTLSRGRQVIRVLTGSGPDGSIRDLVWDGRDSQGRRVRAGTYRWQLSAKATDGEGTLTAADGINPVSGTIVKKG
jgi:hypothetical protein